MRKLGRPAETAVHRIEARLQVGERLRSGFAGQRGRGTGRRLEPGQRLVQPGALVGDRVALLAVRRRDARQELQESRQAVPRFLREIGTADVGLAVRGEKHRQRPAAGAPCQQRVRRLVDPVEVGPFLAVDLDVDKERIHHRRDVRILERLVRHHVAPMARRIADRQQDRLPFASRLGERRVVPRLPVNRVVGVLQQVGARRPGEAVRHRRSRWAAPGQRRRRRTATRRAAVSPTPRTRRARSPRRAAGAG